MPAASTSLPIAGFTAAGSWVPVSVLEVSVLVMRLSPPDAGGASIVRGCGMPGVPRRSSSAVVAEDELGHAARLRLTLDLVGQSPHDLRAPVERLDLGDLDVHPDAAADGQRRGEAHLVEAVVEDHPEALDHADRPEQARRQAEGEEPVLDGLPVRPGGRALGVDVDPLLVAGELRERGDLVLLDGLPVAHPHALADPALQSLEPGDDQWSGGGRAAGPVGIGHPVDTPRFSWGSAARGPNPVAAESSTAAGGRPTWRCRFPAEWECRGRAPG